MAFFKSRENDFGCSMDGIKKGENCDVIFLNK